ncbi:hypothetical protein TRFO_12668 [Tritrichomonas foetus]|uniref:Uncharacterized protein n=1 Tax=Tritrichomonas foetus TaxID=1144522 RepID=A0A1J4L127_9EUKA|nr:hypothetical protein TRFO_12668 [Tritrichomonas foetus]|eukprot:OHT17139.1 hypothetical protein TRFO_12668 [Tritrichomonas foetus]
MNLHRRVLMTANNRNVSDMSREELEELVMEMQDQLDIRKKREAQLKEQVTIAGAKVKAVEASLQDQNLDFIVPPSALRPNYAQNYANFKGQDSDIATKENGDPGPLRYEARIAGSYNPYQGANRRIVTLRQKIGDLQQNIVDTHKDMLELQKELERLRALLENREPPKNEAFRHEKPIPKTKPKKKKITLTTCIKYCKDLLKEEKDPKSHDELLCVYYLLTKDDVLALELFGKLLAPDLKPDDLAELDDLLKDREAQVSILREQYRHLLARHEPLRDAFRDLKERLPNHVFDNDEVAKHLREQIEELLKLIAGIPDMEKLIEELRAKKASLLADKDALFAEGGKNMADLDAEMRRRLAEISEDKAGVEQEKRQLEELDKRIRERYHTIAEEVRRMKADELELRRMLDDREKKKKEMHDKLVILQNTGLKNPMQVRKVYEMCKEMSPNDLSHERNLTVEDCNKYSKILKDLKKECTRLKNSYQDKQQQQYAYELRIRQLQHQARNDYLSDDGTDF